MSSQKNSSVGVLSIVTALVVLMALSAWLWHRHAEQTAPPVNIAATGTNVNSPPSISAATNIQQSNHPSIQPSNRSLQTSNSTPQSAPGSIYTPKQLADLRASLAAMPAKEAVAAIRQMLDSKTDASTQLGFKLAKDGFLTEAPTLRTFLLDELGRLDPAAAADYAKVILASMDSPDEWAVALRNLARGDTSTDGHNLLAEKTAAMLQNTAWQQNPSVGFLESFDVAVYLGGTSLMPALTEMVKRPDDPAISHAAFLTLDRLVINDPATALAALQADPGLMQGREATRADYFARADVRDPQQKTVLENYLLNPQISAAELDTFVGIFPNANYMISPNLLTPTPTPDRATLNARDAESLRVAQAWLADPRFAKLQPVLQKSVIRLQEFVRQEQGQ